jgi:hypothetical protein
MTPDPPTAPTVWLTYQTTVPGPQRTARRCIRWVYTKPGQTFERT